MKLYLISQEQHNGYDTYDSAVVAAESEAEARNMHPDGRRSGVDPDDRSPNWATDIEKIDVEYLGYAADEEKYGVICASYNAG